MPLQNLELTTGEKTLIEHWKKYKAQYRKPPSQRWLAQQLGVYPNAIQHMLKNLKAKGFVVEERVTATRLTLSAKARKVGP